MKTRNNNESVNINSYGLIAAAILLCSQVFLNKSLAQDLYWFGPDATEGGPGNWSSTGHWSTTSPTKTSAGAPTTANDAYLQGPSSGVITFSITTAEMRDLYINTSGYTLQSNTPNVNFRLRNFLGPAVSSTTITNSVNTTFNFVIDSVSTAFTGNFTEGTGTLNLRKQGDGILDITGISSISYTGTTQVDGGTLRMDIGDLGSGNMIIGSVAPYVQGIFESNGTYTRSLGSGAGEVRMGFGSGMRGGFSAYGADLNVNFGGMSGTVNWANSGATNIVLDTFVVGTTTSTHTTNVLNNINITVAGPKTLRTENGAAAIDANFTGTISGMGALNKTGGGTTQFNNYSAGDLAVNEGTLYINGTISQAVDRNMTVATGARLGGYATTDTSAGLRNTTVQADAVFAPGRGNTSGPFGSFSLYGDLDMQTDSVLAFGIGPHPTSDQLVRLGGAWSFDPNQRVTLYDYGIPTMGTFAYPIITGLTSDPGVSGWTIYDSPGVGGYFYYDSGTVYYMVPEAKHVGIFALAALLVVMIYRSRKASASRQKVA